MCHEGIKCPMPSARAMWLENKELGVKDKEKYQKIVGALNYFAITTRYDIAHSVSRLSQMSAKPTVGAARALQRVLRDLRVNSTLTLEGVRTTANTLESFSDSDRGGDRPAYTQSQTGMMITLNDVPVVMGKS